MIKCHFCQHHLDIPANDDDYASWDLECPNGHADITLNEKGEIIQYKLYWDVDPDARERYLLIGRSTGTHLLYSIGKGRYRNYKVVFKTGTLIPIQIKDNAIQMANLSFEKVGNLFLNCTYCQTPCQRQFSSDFGGTWSNVSPPHLEDVRFRYLCDRCAVIFQDYYELWGGFRVRGCPFCAKIYKTGSGNAPQFIVSHYAKGDRDYFEWREVIRWDFIPSWTPQNVEEKLSKLLVFA